MAKRGRPGKNGRSITVAQISTVAPVEQSSRTVVTGRLLGLTNARTRLKQNIDATIKSSCNHAKRFSLHACVESPFVVDLAKFWPLVNSDFG